MCIGCTWWVYMVGVQGYTMAGRPWWVCLPPTLGMCTLPTLGMCTLPTLGMYLPVYGREAGIPRCQGGGYTTMSGRRVYHCFTLLGRFKPGLRRVSLIILPGSPCYSRCFLSKPHVNPLLNPAQRALLHKTAINPVLYFILRFAPVVGLSLGLRRV